MQALRVNRYTITTALGQGVDENWSALQGGRSGLSLCSLPEICTLDTWVGEVKGLSDVVMPEKLASFDCRNHRLAALALKQDGFEESVEQAIAQYGADRVGVFVGTSTSGIQQTEMAYDERQSRLESDESLPNWYTYETTHNIYSPAEFVRQWFGLNGACLAISTACSSSAKVFASAERAIRAGICDAAVVGGVDTLCSTTLYGFNSLQVISDQACRPSDKNRRGISIGEAAGFALLDRSSVEPGEVALLGWGESADAHHMSTPHPEGLGAKIAMEGALQRAALSESDIGYVNLHGTGTTANDLSESLAVSKVFGDAVPASSTKGWTGHTLGAAGIVEAVFSMEAINNNWVPQSLNTECVDPKISINILLSPQEASLKAVLSNSFGFGGSNCSLVFGRAK